MSANKFTAPDATDDEWADVRMQDPDEGEWDVDVVVAGGRVEYVDLRIRPDHLAPFIDCLFDDVGPERANAILSQVADSTERDPDHESVDDDGGRS